MLTEHRRSRWTAWRRPLMMVALVAVLLALGIGVILGVTRAHPIAAVRPHSTATATAAPRVVYQSDWSRGPDGWALPTSAKLVDGHLLLGGAAAVAVAIPYTPTTANYAIVMDFQIVAAAIGGHFGLTARNAAGDRQYLAQMQCTPMHQGAWTPALGGCAGAVLVAARGGTYPSGLWTSDYVVHGGPQTFRLEVTGDQVNFCPAGDCLVPVTSATPMDAAPRLLIEDRAVKLLVTRVTVSTL